MRQRGDILKVGLDPVSGREQAGFRPVMVVTDASFNRYGTPLICPITTGGQFARHLGFAVSLAGTGLKTQGVVLCHQPRVLDLDDRGARFIERAPQQIVDEVLARLATLIE